MTEAEYRRHPAISRSELWHIHKSPLKLKYFMEHPSDPTPVLLFGRVFHKLALEAESFFDEFAIEPDVDKRTKGGKKEWADFMEGSAEKTVIPADMYKQAMGMCEALAAEPFAVRLLSGQREVPFFWTDDLTMEECKCRVDCLNTNFSQPIIVELKSTNDASTDGFIRSAINYGYDFQSAMYSEGVECNIGRKPLFVFIAVEKDPPYAVNIMQADELFLRRGYNLFRDYIGTYHSCKLTGNWYGYLGKNKQINNLALPSWLAKDVD